MYVYIYIYTYLSIYLNISFIIMLNDVTKQVTHALLPRESQRLRSPAALWSICSATSSLGQSQQTWTKWTAEAHQIHQGSSFPRCTSAAIRMEDNAFHWHDWHVENIHPNSGRLISNTFWNIFKNMQDYARIRLANLRIPRPMRRKKTEMCIKFSRHENIRFAVCCLTRICFTGNVQQITTKKQNFVKPVCQSTKPTQKQRMRLDIWRNRAQRFRQFSSCPCCWAPMLCWVFGGDSVQQ